MREKSISKRLTLGDRNSDFFHRVANVKKKCTSTQVMNIDGVSTTDQVAIPNHMVNFYSNHFSSNISEPQVIGFVDQIIPQRVFDNNFLTRTPSDDEIRMSVFSKDGHSAPGLDGFPGNFYQHFDVCVQNGCMVFCSWYYLSSAELEFNSAYS